MALHERGRSFILGNIEGLLIDVQRILRGLLNIAILRRPNWDVIRGIVHVVGLRNLGRFVIVPARFGLLHRVVHLLRLLGLAVADHLLVLREIVGLLAQPHVFGQCRIFEIAATVAALDQPYLRPLVTLGLFMVVVFLIIVREPVLH